MAAPLRALARADRAIWVILAVALSVRVGFIASTLDYQAYFDAADVYRHATSIADGRGFPESLLAAGGGPTALRSPASMYLLGGVFTIFGDDITAGRVAGAILGALTTVFVYLIARELWDRRVAFVAGLFAALFPPLVLWQTALLTEPLFLAVEMGIVYAVLVLRRSPHPVRWAILAGVLCGIAALTRSNGALLAIPAALGAWTVVPRLSPRALAAPFTVAVCTVLTIAPWTIRNAAEFDHFVPTTTQSGMGLAGIWNQEAMIAETDRATWVGPRLLHVHRDLFQRRDLDEAELDAELRERALDFASSHPKYVAEASALNLLRSFGFESTLFGNSIQVNGGTLGVAGVEVLRWPAVVLTLVALLAAVILTRPGPPRWGPLFVWLVPLVMVASSIMISGDPRYRAPVDPFLCLLSAVATVWLWDGLRNLAASRRSPLLSPPADASGSEPSGSGESG